jgi:cysteine desulfurase
VRTVYLDNNATTRVPTEVVEAMLPFYTEFYGNPSSVHRLGSRPAAAVLRARRSVAQLLRCDEGDVVFTSGGTESNNLAVRGALAALPSRRHIVTTTVEHPAVSRIFERLENDGYRTTYVPVDAEGRPDLDRLEAALGGDTALVSVMYANNETGVLLPVDEIAAIVRDRDVLLHVDAVTAMGKVPIDLSRLPADLLAASGHKFHAPKGVGVLFCRTGTPFAPVMDGSAQERGRRPGTENVPGIVGLGRACDIAAGKMEFYDTEVRRLRDRLEAGLTEAIPGAHVNGAGAPRIPTTTNVTFPGVDARDVLLLMDEAGICASAGRACSSGAGAGSAVLLAMGRSEADAAASIRFSLGAWTTGTDIDYVVETVPPIVERLRERKRA